MQITDYNHITKKVSKNLSLTTLKVRS